MEDKTITEEGALPQGEVVDKEKSAPISKIVTVLQDEAGRVGTSPEDKSLLDAAYTTLQSVGADWDKKVADALAKQPDTSPAEIVQDLMTPKAEMGKWPPRPKIGTYVELTVQKVDTLDINKLKGATVGYRPSVTQTEVEQQVLFQARQATVAGHILKGLGFIPQESSLEAVFNRPMEKLELFQTEFRGHKVSGNVYDLMWEEGEPVKRTQWEVFALKSPTLPDVRAGVSFWMNAGKMDVRLHFDFGPGAVAQSISPSPAK